MSSDQDKMYVSSENEGRKRPGAYPSSDEKPGRSVEEFPDAGAPPMRYYPSGMAQAGMAPRPGAEHMMRQGPMHGAARTGMSEDSDLTDAMVFLNRIKEEYAESLPVYDSFLETMRDFKFGKIDADEVCKAVRILFKEKPFLVRQFDEYLPNHLRYSEGRSYAAPPVPEREREKYPPYRMQGYAAQQMPMGRMAPPGAMPLGRPAVPMPPPHYMARSSMPPSPVQHSPKSKQPQPGSCDADGSKQQMANDFIQLVKRKYAAKPIVYRQFIELLQNSKNGFDKLLSHVSALLVDTPELIERFERNFRPTGEAAVAGDADPLRGVKDVLSAKGVLEDFLRILNFYNQNFIGLDDLIFMLEPIIGDKESMRAFKAFIKYEEPTGCYDIKRFKDYEKVGSYKIYPAPITLGTGAPLAREVLNNMCVSVSILESEDSYVFRHKNSSEELLARVNDERSESDLHLDRLKYLISKLEELYTHMGESRLDMDDIEMSAALIKETFRRVYESKSSEVLEAILANPRRAIPVVLKRLHKVYKENLALHRRRKKFWRCVVDENYYKAYDTRGVLFKADERAVIALRNVHAESCTPFSARPSDPSVLEFIRDLYRTLATTNENIGCRKISVEKQMAFFDSVLARLTTEGSIFTTHFDYYALCLYVLTVYMRLAELQEMHFEPLHSNPAAVAIGYQADFHVPDRLAEVRRFTLQLLAKEIDSDTYEEHVRQLTDSKGYKLYNLRKIFSRIEKQVILLTDTDPEAEFEPSFPGQYSIGTTDGVVTMCRLEDSIEPEEAVDV
ncbi:hypothetical protein PAPHI01_0607 [Pancytospora philotis]|nr:hypothetical protein PAPHI01_0607 [Pancytospora philotis]